MWQTDGEINRSQRVRCFDICSMLHISMQISNVPFLDWIVTCLETFRYQRIHFWSFGMNDEKIDNYFPNLIIKRYEGFIYPVIRSEEYKLSPKETEWTLELRNDTFCNMWLAWDDAGLNFTHGVTPDHQREILYKNLWKVTLVISTE